MQCKFFYTIFTISCKVLFYSFINYTFGWLGFIMIMTILPSLKSSYTFTCNTFIIWTLLTTYFIFLKMYIFNQDTHSEGHWGTFP